MNKMIATAIALCVFSTNIFAQNDGDAANKQNKSQVAEKKEFSVISSIASFPAAETLKEVTPYELKFSPMPVINEFNGGQEYLIKGSNNFAGCWFPESDARLKTAIKNGKGILAPIFKIPGIGVISKDDKILFERIDWNATKNLHTVLSQKLKLNILPFNETQNYWKFMSTYLDKIYKEDVNRYLDISDAGGGIFGQIIGNIFDKNNSFSKTRDPNFRLAGIYRNDYYENVIKNFPDVEYIITSNDAMAIALYYDALPYSVYSKQDKERLALNLQKDVSGNIQEIRSASMLYQYGTIDDYRAQNSSVGTILASSLIKISFHQNLNGDEYAKYNAYRDMLKAVKDFDDKLFMVRTGNGINISFSMVEKYKNMNLLGIDKNRIFCGAYDQVATKNLLKITDEIKNIREQSVQMANPLVFAISGNYPTQLKARQDNVDRVLALLKETEILDKNIRSTNSNSENYLFSTVLPTAFSKMGYSGFIASKKLN